jgi:tRNA(Met) cytidine acetyltransferase
MIDVYTGPDRLNPNMMAGWLERLRAHRQRGVLVFAGEADWCREAAAWVLAESGLAAVTWVSTMDRPGSEVLPAKQAKGLLGQERDAIVFDAHAGFDADAFGAVSGTICGGGVLLLLCLPLDAWPSFADPAAECIAVWPHAVDDLSGRFLRRLSRVLGDALASGQDIFQVTPTSDDAPSLRQVSDQQGAGPVGSIGIEPQSQKRHQTENDAPIFEGDMFRSDDQRAAVEAIEHVLHGHRRRPLVLVADRGRGKTAALGIAAARLLRAASHGQSPAAHDSPRALRILVTAPRLAAVEPLFRHALAQLPGADMHAGRLQWGEAQIRFVAPDELRAALPSADLLLVDEAAAIPVSILQPLLKHYSRIVFSTTTHGYEGTGRGFAVRFVQTLNAHTPGWSELNLREPIRWASGDPLERLVFDALLLEAKCAEDARVSSVDPRSLQVERISRDRLLDDEALLTQLFGLLVVAHYRTRPNDLRNLLDGPGLAVYLMMSQGTVVATALVAMEGGFDGALIGEIAAGRRRPRGHLIPQSLVAHVGIKSAGGLRCARVMRIAVHPALQRRGLGRHLLQHVKDDAERQGVDMIGASFGATAALLRFWRSENLWPVRVGFRRDHASGEHSVMVLSALSAAGRSVVSEARARLSADLPQGLSDPLRDLDTEVAALSLEKYPQEKNDVAIAAPSQRDFHSVQGFVDGERSYEDCLASIWRSVVWASQESGQLSECTERGVVVAKVLQRHSWADVARQFNLAGKAEVKQRLQLGLRQMLDIDLSSS